MVQTPTEQAELSETEQTPSEAPSETLSETPSEAAEQTPTGTSAKKVRITRGAALVSARYDKSFTAKLIQSDDELKGWYSSLKNALLGYKKVNSRISWRTDSINRGRTKLAKFAIRGKTLGLYLALNPDDYANTKYKVERAENKRYEDVPCLYRIKNGRRAKYALELIATLAEKFELQPIEREYVDYYLPYEETEPLLERGLVKEIVYKADEPVQIDPDGKVAQEVAATEVHEEQQTKESAVTQVVLPFDRNAVQYIRSFTAKLIQSNDEVKAWYTELKNELLSYKKVKARRSWKRESYRIGRKNVVRFSFRGKMLCMYFALNPNEFEGSKYKVENVAAASYADTPCLYRMKNNRRVRYAKDLISMVMGSVGAERNEEYVPEEVYLPYEDTEPLIEKGLIKVINITPRAQTAAEEEPTGEAELTPEEEPVEEEEETAEEIAAAEVPDDEPTEESNVEETAEEDTEVEELSKQELADVQSYEEEAKDDDGIEVVGVMFRRRGRKVYWFDPDGNTWEKGEIALYKSPDNPPQEVIVVDNAKISQSKLHLPLKPLHKLTRRPQTDNRHRLK